MFKSKRSIWSPCSKHAVLEGKINRNFANNQEKYFILKLNLYFWSKMQTYKFAELSMKGQNNLENFTKSFGRLCAVWVFG